MGPRGQLALAVWQGWAQSPGAGEKGVVKRHPGVLKAASFSLEHSLRK